MARPSEATCIVAREIGAPVDVEAIEWRLLTNRETAGFDRVVELKWLTGIGRAGR